MVQDLVDLRTPLFEILMGGTYRSIDQRAIRHCFPRRRIGSHRILKLSKVQPIRTDTSIAILSQHQPPARSSMPLLAAERGTAGPTVSMKT